MDKDEAIKASEVFTSAMVDLAAKHGITTFEFVGYLRDAPGSTIAWPVCLRWVAPEISTESKHVFTINAAFGVAVQLVKLGTGKGAVHEHYE